MRQIAHHIWIGELLGGRYEERAGWEPNVLHTGRGSVSRVNLIGTLLTMGSQTVLDDGTGQISLRAYEDVPGLKQATTGMIVLVVGRPRGYGDEIYLVPEIIREVDPAWAIERQKRLGEVQEYVALAQTPKETVVEQVFDNDAEKVIAIISGIDTGDGADVGEVIEQSGLGERAEKIVEQLLLDGDIFEIRPGVVKVL